MTKDERGKGELTDAEIMATAYLELPKARQTGSFGELLRAISTAAYAKATAEAYRRAAEICRGQMLNSTDDSATLRMHDAALGDCAAAIEREAQ